MDPLKKNLALSALSGLAGAIGGYAYCKWITAAECDTDKPTLQSMGTVVALNIYPVKSCGPIALKQGYCAQLGIVSGWLRDRAFMITDEHNHFITARQEPSLLLVQPSVSGDELCLQAPGMDKILVSVPKLKGTEPTKKCRIWGQDTKGIDCGDKVSSWLSSYLEKPNGNVRLVYHPWEKTERIPPDEKMKNWELFRESDSTVFGDICPFLLTSEASFKDLKSHLNGKSPVSMHNFRPNIIISGSQPFEEDYWKYVKIGKVPFRTVRPCQRCVLTNINPQTGVRGEEPLKTLKGYRKLTGPPWFQRTKDEAPVFGQYLGIEQFGTISVGDNVYAA